MILLWSVNIIIQGERTLTFSTGTEGEGRREQEHSQNPPGDKTTEIDGGWKQQIMQKYFNDHKSFFWSAGMIGLLLPRPYL